MLSTALFFSPTAWFLALITTHLVIQTVLQGETLHINAFGLGVLELIEHAPDVGRRVVLANSTAQSLQPSSALVELKSTPQSFSAASSTVLASSATPTTTSSPASTSVVPAVGTTSVSSAASTHRAQSNSSLPPPISRNDAEEAKEDGIGGAKVSLKPHEDEFDVSPEASASRVVLEGNFSEPDDEESREEADSDNEDNNSEDSDDEDDVSSPDRRKRSATVAEARGYIRRSHGLVRMNKRLHRVPVTMKRVLRRQTSDHHDSDSEDEETKHTNGTSISSKEVLYAIAGLKSDDGRELVVSTECAQSLDWPIDLLSHYQRQNITFLFFQTWLALLSLFALAYGSVPHLLATIICHFLALGYSIFQSVSTHQFHDKFHQDIVLAACAGSALLPRYWEDVLHLQIGTAVVEGILTLLFVVVAWKLYPVMDWTTWKLIGANEGSRKVYKFILTYRIALQMGGFFIITFQALWLNEICHARERTLETGFFLSHSYQILLGILTAFVPLWLVLGWVVVGGPKSKLSEAGKRAVMFFGIDGLGKKVGWRGGKGWGMTGKRARNLKLAVFAFGSFALLANLVFLLSQLADWKWSFMTFIGSISAVLMGIIVLLAAFVVHTASSTTWEELDNDASKVEDDHDEKENMQISFPNEVEPYLFMDPSQNSIPRGFDIIVLPPQGHELGNNQGATLNRMNSTSSIKSSQGQIGAQSNFSSLVSISAQPSQGTIKSSRGVTIPPPIKIPPRAVTGTTLDIAPGLKSQFSATTASSPTASVSGTFRALQSRFSSPTATESSEWTGPTVPAVPRNLGRFSNTTTSSTLRKGVRSHFSSPTTSESGVSPVPTLPSLNLSRFSALSEDLFDGEKRTVSTSSKRAVE